MKQKWIPSCEKSNWMDVDTTITSWKSSKGAETCVAYRNTTKKEISIPKDQIFHLLEHMANHAEAIDEEHLASDRHALENDLNV